MRSAKEYIALIDGAEGMEVYEFLCQCALLLPQIYYHGQLLPEVELEDDRETYEKDDEKLAGSTEEYFRISQKLNAFLGKHDLYAEVFDPISDREFLTTGLSDDLADIYQDIRCQFPEYESGEKERVNEAIWQWKYGIEGHSGYHIVSALRPIHWLVYNHLRHD